MAAATEALSDETVPRCGMWNRPLHRRATASRVPFPSEPTTSPTGPDEVEAIETLAVARAGGEDGEAALAQVVDDAHQVVDLGDPHPLGGAGRGLDRARRHRRRALGRDHHAVRAQDLRAADDRAQVVRVGDAVEQHHQRRLVRLRRRAQDVVDGDVAKTPRHGDQPLVDGVARHLGHQTPGPDLRR